MTFKKFNGQGVAWVTVGNKALVAYGKSRHEARHRLAVLIGEFIMGESK